jgi:hypothetical protein
MKMYITISEIINTHKALSTNDGNKVFEIIKNNFDKVEKFILDFENIEKITSTFLNASIGQIYGLNKEEYIKNKIEYINFPEDKTSRLEDVIENAILFYENQDKIN